MLKSGGHGTGNGAVELQGHVPEALQSVAPDGYTAGGTVRVTFSSADLDAARQAMAGAGRISVSPAAEVPAGPFAGVRGFVLYGVEGETVEVVQRSSSAGQQGAVR